MTKCKKKFRGFLGGALAVHPCTILSKFLHPEAAEALDLSATVRVAVAAHDLNDGVGELYLAVKNVAIGIVPAANALAIVFSGIQLERAEVILKAREVAHWFEIFHGSGQKRYLPAGECGESEGDGNEEAGVQDLGGFNAVLRDVVGTPPLASWLTSLEKIPNIVVGALLDFTLSEQPVVTVPARSDARGTGDMLLWTGLWGSVATSCKSIATGRRERRVARRKNRQAGKVTICSADQKTNRAHLKFSHTTPPLDVYIKMVRLPEHDPCLVAICCGDAKPTLPRDYLDDLERLLSVPVGLEAAPRGLCSVDEFPASVQAAMSSASATIKQIFPKPKSLALGKQIWKLQHQPNRDSGTGMSHPVPPETPKEGLSPKAARRFGLGRLAIQPTIQASDDSATNSVEVDGRDLSFDSVEVMIRELDEFGL